MSIELKPGTMHKLIPACKVGSAEIVHDSPSVLERLRGRIEGMPLEANTYTRLLINGCLWMSDAEFECRIYQDIIREAKGNVLIAGLGIGLILPPLLAKKTVATLTVLEINQDVIDCVKPHFNSPKLTITQADCNTWLVPKRQFDMIFVDIWPNVPNEDQRREIQGLRKRYRPGLKRGGKLRVWCEDYATRP